MIQKKLNNGWKNHNSSILDKTSSTLVISGKHNELWNVTESYWAAVKIQMHFYPGITKYQIVWYVKNLYLDVLYKMLPLTQLCYLMDLKGFCKTGDSVELL